MSDREYILKEGHPFSSIKVKEEGFQDTVFPVRGNVENNRDYWIKRLNLRLNSGQVDRKPIKQPHLGNTDFGFSEII